MRWGQYVACITNLLTFPTSTREWERSVNHAIKKYFKRRWREEKKILPVRGWNEIKHKAPRKKKKKMSTCKCNQKNRKRKSDRRKISLPYRLRQFVSLVFHLELFYIIEKIIFKQSQIESTSSRQSVKENNHGYVIDNFFFFSVSLTLIQLFFSYGTFLQTSTRSKMENSRKRSHYRQGAE